MSDGFQTKMRVLRGLSPLECSECRSVVDKPYSRGVEDELHCSEKCYQAYVKRLVLVDRLSTAMRNKADRPFLSNKVPHEELERLFGSGCVPNRKPKIPNGIEDDSLDALIYAMQHYESPPDDD